MKITMKFIALLLLTLFLSCSSDDDGDKKPKNNLEQIQGSWVRVGGNNPQYDGMVVNVQNDNGVISISGNFPFPAGKVKWRNIIAQDEKYIIEDLFDNGNYTRDGILKLGVDDTLRISHPGSGPGSAQKWVR